MTSLPDPPASKGMKMIAAYRAARLSQRPVLRTALRQNHAALRQSREQTLRPVEPIPPQPVQSPIHEEHPEQAELLDAGSIFAGLVTAAISDAPPIAANQAPNKFEALEVLPSDLADTRAEPVRDDVTVSSDQPSYDPPLAEIGFGPGMLIRLSQLGLHTMRDLAAADVGALRAGLGDISRLVNVEAWVNNARDHMKRQSAGLPGSEQQGTRLTAGSAATAP